MSKIIRFVGYLLFIAIILMLLYAYAMFQGGFVSWFLFFSFFPISLYQMILLFYPLKSWKLRRTLSHKTIRAGDSISVTITIKRKIPLPLFYCIFEEVVPKSLRNRDLRSDKYYYLNEPNKLIRKQNIKKVLFPWFRREFIVQYDLEHIPRGEHLLNLIQVKTGDIFGFIKKEAYYQIIDELVVFPSQRPIQMKGKLTYLNQGENPVQSLFQTNSNVVTGIREYVPGDKFSWIDWKQTARNHVMMSKEFEQDKSTQVLLVLNACHNDKFNEIAFEAAIELTLSLMMDLEKRQSTVDLLSIGSSTVHLKSRDLKQKKETIYQYLTRIKPGQLHSFSKQLLDELTTIGRQPFVIVITPYIDKTLYETIRRVSKQAERLVMIYIQSENVLQEQFDMLQQFESKVVTTVILTEKEMMNNPIEVKL